MNEETQQLAKDLRDTIGQGRRYSEVSNYNQLFIDAEGIVSVLAYLISPVMEMEQAYRQKIVEYMEDGDSHAKAKAKAEATKEYAEWKKYEALMKLGDEQVKLIKKFSDKLELEYKRSGDY